MYKFAYLIGCLLFLLIWLALFYFRRDLRRQMLVMGILTAIAGPVLEILFYTRDWWRPLTVTGTLIGIEDILLGFTNGGIAAVLYEEVFGQYLRRERESRSKPHLFLIVSLVGVVVMVTSFSFFYLHSFLSNMIAFAAQLLIILFLRRDLFRNVVLSGVLMTVCVVPVYVILIKIFPGWIDNFWYHENLSGIMFLGIPVEDLVWYFGVGAVGGPLYEFWHGYYLEST